MQPSTFYHLYNHANGNENLFRNDENYRFFLQKYAKHISPVADTYAYCLMPNHLHFLIKIKSEEEIISAFGKFANQQKLEYRISKQFANLFSSYTQAYNKVFERRGSLFIPNFKRKAIEDDDYFTNLVHYIHSNAVHHGFVKNTHELPHSSYHALQSTKVTKLKREEVWAWFYGKEEFLKIHSTLNPSNKLLLEMDF